MVQYRVYTVKHWELDSALRSVWMQQFECLHCELTADSGLWTKHIVWTLAGLQIGLMGFFWGKDWKIRSMDS